MMAGDSIWWSLQPSLADDDANFRADPAARAKQLQVAEDTRKAYYLSESRGGWKRVSALDITSAKTCSSGLPHAGFISIGKIDAVTGPRQSKFQPGLH